MNSNSMLKCVMMMYVYEVLLSMLLCMIREIIL